MSCVHSFNILVRLLYSFNSHCERRLGIELCRDGFANGKRVLAGVVANGQNVAHLEGEILAGLLNEVVEVDVHGL